MPQAIPDWVNARYVAPRASGFSLDQGLQGRPARVGQAPLRSEQQRRKEQRLTGKKTLKIAITWPDDVSGEFRWTLQRNIRHAVEAAVADARLCSFAEPQIIEVVDKRSRKGGLRC